MNTIDEIKGRIIKDISELEALVPGELVQIARGESISIPKVFFQRKQFMSYDRFEFISWCRLMHNAVYVEVYDRENIQFKDEGIFCESGAMTTYRASTDREVNDRYLQRITQLLKHPELGAALT